MGYLNTPHGRAAFLQRVRAGGSFYPYIDEAQAEIDTYLSGRDRVLAALRFADIISMVGGQLNHPVLAEMFYERFVSHWLPEIPTESWQQVDALMRYIFHLASDMP